MQTFYDGCWWFAGVVLPLLLTVVAGIPLAIYTGVVVSRLTEFKAQRFNALHALSVINMRLLQAKHFYDAGDEIRNALLAPGNAFKADGQQGAYVGLDCIRQNLERKFYEMCTEYDDRSVDMAENNDHWLATRMHLITCDEWKGILLQAMDIISKIEPDLWTTFKPTLPCLAWGQSFWRYLETYIGENRVHRPCEGCNCYKVH